MKKIKFLLTISILLLTGCEFSNDSMDHIDILTSTYPVEYVVKTLYGTHSTITSLYPKDDDTTTFEVTDVLLKQYSSNDLFIFNGLSKEKDFVKSMIKDNNKLKIIDVTSNLNYDNSIEELWLDPNNLLTIANNVRKGFSEYIKSTYLTNEIDENYDNLKILLTSLDGKYYSTAKNSSNKTIIVSDDAFLYLEKYGINVISLDEDTKDQKKVSDAIKLIENGDCDYIFIKYGQNSEDFDEYNAKTIELYTMTNLYNIDTEKSDYITLMNQNLENLKLELYK